ncbi:DUF4181 domain-containing protein [Robertmurraya sp. P23]|uniref:DUF4181 domain-containing protein n=1 Tax=Robertmurraya sp. P23 TaxID=3436931 RepID=UPI003D9933E9
MDRWVRSIIVVLFLISLSPLNTFDSRFVIMLYWLTLLGFQGIMEYIYIKNSKQYISTTILLILGLIIIYTISIFYSLDFL